MDKMFFTSRREARRSHSPSPRTALHKGPCLVYRNDGTESFSQTPTMLNALTGPQTFRKVQAVSRTSRAQSTSGKFRFPWPKSAVLEVPLLRLALGHGDVSPLLNIPSSALRHRPSRHLSSEYDGRIAPTMHPLSEILRLSHIPLPGNISGSYPSFRIPYFVIFADSLPKGLRPPLVLVLSQVSPPDLQFLGLNRPSSSPSEYTLPSSVSSLPFLHLCAIDTIFISASEPCVGNSFPQPIRATYLGSRTALR
ncbi:hypothetical protein NMY22_g972 [Coprinellus aureogranulatus]|nr:hypothetical protein NMY22_g972 [Coprinellus aureogranulatus]